jgi:tetratricopeptide (TPR) repeat protein
MILGDLFEILVAKKASWSSDKLIKEQTQVSFIRYISIFSFYNILRNVFQQASQMFPDNINFLLAHLSFESLYSVDEARKLAKNLLKSKQTEIILWNWYAQFEKKAGKIEDARKVCSTALSLQHQLPAKSQADSPLLFRNYAELELSLGNRENALYALSCVFDPPFVPLKKGEIAPPTKIMKAKKVRIFQEFSS